MMREDPDPSGITIHLRPLSPISDDRSANLFDRTFPWNLDL
jgi:hypothetical protein